MFNISVTNVYYSPLDSRSVYIGRGAGRYTPSALHNPFIIGKGYVRGEAFIAYKEWFMDKARRKDFSANEKNELRKIYNMAQEPDGVKLACHCKQPNHHRDCHGDIIKSYLEFLYNSN